VHDVGLVCELDQLVLNSCKALKKVLPLFFFFVHEALAQCDVGAHESSIVEASEIYKEPREKHKCKWAHYNRGVVQTHCKKKTNQPVVRHTQHIVQCDHHLPLHFGSCSLPSSP
jgi:hypothetical protein